MSLKRGSRRANWFGRISGAEDRGDQQVVDDDMREAVPENDFRPTANGYFMAICGPAWHANKAACQKKLCFVYTDRYLLTEELRQLARRPECHYVKHSVYPRDGMYLSRCFLVDEREVGAVWGQYKKHPRLFCSVQDDDFVTPFRASSCRRVGHLPR